MEWLQECSLRINFFFEDRASFVFQKPSVQHSILHLGINAIKNMLKFTFS